MAPGKIGRRFLNLGNGLKCLESRPLSGGKIGRRFLNLGNQVTVISEQGSNLSKIMSHSNMARSHSNDKPPKFDGFV